MFEQYMSSAATGINLAGEMLEASDRPRARQVLAAAALDLGRAEELSDLTDVQRRTVEDRMLAVTRLLAATMTC